MVKKFFKAEDSIEKKERELEYNKTFIATITGALTFVAGLFWRDAINGVLQVLPESQGIIGQIISAVIITGIFVYIVVKLNYRVRDMEKEFEKEKKKNNKKKK